MREQNIEVIRKACVAANPDIMYVNSNTPTQTLRAHFRSIHLADVLLAIESKGYYTQREKDAWHVVCKWKLRKDSLTEQSDECLTFLANLLK